MTTLEDTLIAQNLTLQTQVANLTESLNNFIQSINSRDLRIADLERQLKARESVISSLTEVRGDSLARLNTISNLGLELKKQVAGGKLSTAQIIPLINPIIDASGPGQSAHEVVPGL